MNERAVHVPLLVGAAIVTSASVWSFRNYPAWIKPSPSFNERASTFRGTAEFSGTTAGNRDLRPDPSHSTQAASIRCRYPRSCTKGFSIGIGIRSAFCAVPVGSHVTKTVANLRDSIIHVGFSALTVYTAPVEFVSRTASSKEAFGRARRATDDRRHRTRLTL